LQIVDQGINEFAVVEDLKTVVIQFGEAALEPELAALTFTGV
jgi:hypothetical protein